MRMTPAKFFIGSILVCAAFFAVMVFLTSDSVSSSQKNNANNTSMVDGKQIIDITAKGGYSPKTTVAKADVPTIIKMTTQGTFDCSSTVTIPSINYKKTLQPSGITEIEVPPQKAGTTLQGHCAMGMYNFAVKFN